MRSARFWRLAVFFTPNAATAQSSAKRSQKAQRTCVGVTCIGTGSREIDLANGRCAAPRGILLLSLDSLPTVGLRCGGVVSSAKLELAMVGVAASKPPPFARSKGEKDGAPAKSKSNSKDTAQARLIAYAAHPRC